MPYAYVNYTRKVHFQNKYTCIHVLMPGTQESVQEIDYMEK